MKTIIVWMNFYEKKIIRREWSSIQLESQRRWLSLKFLYLSDEKKLRTKHPDFLLWKSKKKFIRKNFYCGGKITFEKKFFEWRNILIQTTSFISMSHKTLKRRLKSHRGSLIEKNEWFGRSINRSRLVPWV